MDWTFNKSGTSIDYGHYNFTGSSTNSHVNYLQFSNLTHGSYCLSVQLSYYNGSTLVALNSANSCFNISPPPPSGYITSYLAKTTFSVGESVIMNTSSTGLTTNASYIFKYDLKLGSNTVDNGSMSWTASSNNKTHSIQWNNLSAGYYCVWVYLQGHNNYNNSNWYNLNSQAKCFTVSNPILGNGTIETWLEPDAYSGDRLDWEIMTFIQVSNAEYFVEWNLTRNSTVIDNGNYSFTWSSTSYSTHFLSGDTYGLATPSGTYCMNARLENINGYLDSYSTCEVVVDQPVPTIDITFDPLNEYNGSNYIQVGNAMIVEYDLYNLDSNDDYNVDFSVQQGINELDNGSVIQWLYGYEEYSDFAYIDLHQPGYVCIYFTLSNMTQTLDTDQFCIDLYVEGEISIDLTAEYWE